MLSNIEMFQEFLEKHEIKIKDLNTVLGDNMGAMFNQFSNFFKKRVLGQNHSNLKKRIDLVLATLFCSWITLSLIQVIKMNVYFYL
jgi:hypothetical protein